MKYKAEQGWDSNDFSPYGAQYSENTYSSREAFANVREAILLLSDLRYTAYRTAFEVSFSSP